MVDAQSLLEFPISRERSQPPNVNQVVNVSDYSSMTLQKYEQPARKLYRQYIDARYLSRLIEYYSKTMKLK